MGKLEGVLIYSGILEITQKGQLLILNPLARKHSSGYYLPSVSKVHFSEFFSN